MVQSVDHSGDHSGDQRWSGAIDRLEITPGIDAEAASYQLRFLDGTKLSLNDRIGQGLLIEVEGIIVCRYCGREGRRSFGGGYCYDCFVALARCDLCVVSPDRCHYHEGTCREPEWGETFCMTAHRVYLANSSGIKVGITRRGAEIGRWLDQGAIQGMPILDAATRKAAGDAEVRIATLFPDRTDWRKMLRSDVPELDLHAALRKLQASGLDLPEGVNWAAAEEVRRFYYPVPALAYTPQLLKLDKGSAQGNLLGMKGQYLVLSSGALNVRQHAGYRVTVTVTEPFQDTGGSGGGEQLGLF